MPIKRRDFWREGKKKAFNGCRVQDLDPCNLSVNPVPVPLEKMKKKKMLFFSNEARAQQEQMGRDMSDNDFSSNFSLNLRRQHDEGLHMPQGRTFQPPHALAPDRHASLALALLACFK